MRTLLWAGALSLIIVGWGAGCEGGSTDSLGFGADGGGQQGTDAVGGLVDTTGTLSDTADGAAAGEKGGPCYGNGTCNAGLACAGGLCVPGSALTDAGVVEHPDAGGIAPDIGGVAIGSLDGPCYGNGTCNAGLDCRDGVCVRVGGDADVIDDVSSTDVSTPDSSTGGSHVWENPTCFGERPDGEECDDHCQCQSGYCYDEGYMNSFRFCTRNCAGFDHDCVETGDVTHYVCLMFSGPWVDDLEPPVDLRQFCVPRCQSDGDCEAYGAGWDGCSYPDTQWAGHTISAAKTCFGSGE